MEKTSQQLAIVGMACRLPGASNLDEYWRLIIEGRCAISEVPPERLNQEIFYDENKGVLGKTYCKLAALLENRDFDHVRCPVPQEIRDSVDSTHLLMTGVAADALRHAKLDPFNLPTRNVGVFIGHAQGSSRLGKLAYQTYLDDALALLESSPAFSELSAADRDAVRRELGETVRLQFPGYPHSAHYLNCNMVAGTVAKSFGLTGQWLALNSACASSSHAMLMGARALQRGRHEMVLVGGASEIKGDSLVLFSAAQAMSRRASRPFDAEADGLIMGEGYVALVMKTLERALADGDPIQAVVRGLGIATDGRGKSLWAPRKEGQIKAMRRAYRTGVEMSGVQYLECHATATQLGDATELETLCEVLLPVFGDNRRIPITSVKANVGHTLESAGASGVIKSILCMQHRQFPPAVGVEQLNPKVDWDAAPFYVPQQAATWEAPPNGGPRRAAVNAFGIGGLNMHVVLDEFVESTAANYPAAPSLQSESAEDRAVAVIGMGCIFPGAQGPDNFWELLNSGRDPKSHAPADRWSERAVAAFAEKGGRPVGGFVADYQYDWRRHKVPPKQVAEADPLQFMLLDAAEQALNDAGCDLKTMSRELCGVVVGTEFGGDFSDQLEMGLRLPELKHELSALLAKRGATAEKIAAVCDEFGKELLKKWPALKDETGSFTSSTLASRITKTFDLAGGAVSVDSGSTSALSAISICIDALLSGDNDLMICVAGQRRMGPMAYETMHRAGMLSTSPSCHNLLDNSYDGIVPGEGAGAVLLKRLADARRDGDRIHAVIRGFGAAHHESAAEALRLAAGRSQEMSQADLHEIRLAELVTDTQLASDRRELRELAQSHLGPGRKQPLTLDSVAARIGHLGGASGIAALIKAILELENGRATVVAGLKQPAAIWGELDDQVDFPKTPTPLAEQRLAAVAGWSKGQAFHLVLERPSTNPLKEFVSHPAEEITKPVQTIAALSAGAGGTHEQAPRICRFGAQSMPELLQLADGALADVQNALRTAAGRQFFPADRFRLAIVADTDDEFNRKLKLARPQFENPAARQILEQQGVFFRKTPPQAPRVAFVFPGQGSQYEGMLRSLVQVDGAARQALELGDATMAQLGYPSFAELAWSIPSRLGTDIWQTQIAILLADYICLSALRARGILPDLVLGHSYGEFPALLAAGAWDLPTAIAATRARCAGIEAVSSGDTGLLATNAPADVITRTAVGANCRVFIANDNAPDQIVVGGARAHLEKFAEALTADSYQARILAVPAAFHTPLMQGASAQLEQALQQSAIGPPQLTMYSTVSKKNVCNAAQIRQNLATQLTSPVLYAPLIAELAAERPTVFTEVGPQQTLTRLNRRIVGAETAAVAMDDPKRGAAAPLLQVQALLECLGVFDKTPDSSHTEMPTTVVSISQRTSSETPMNDQIPHFDATERRRAKMRGVSVDAAPSSSNGQSKRAEPPPRDVVSNRILTEPPQPALKQPMPVQPDAVAAAASAAPQPAASKTPSATPNSAELESFLINFVVEQTGYPPEVVDLDADLEADLGIDSIKKAQLFGELQEYFEIGASDSSELSLDDFPTLRHVMNFLVESSAGSSQPSAPSANGSLAPAAANPSPLTAVPAANTTPAAVAIEPTVAAASTDELEPFLINFVVEQTGYPPEVVDLDADLEADLGIDSIKKAQLFGELQEYFEIGATNAADLSLDDFPTLRHVLNFLQEASSSAPSAGNEPAEAAKSFPTAAPAPALETTSDKLAPAASIDPPTEASDAELETFLINFVVEQTGYPAEVVDLDADLEADLGIDSIKKAQLFGELQEYFELGSVSAGDLSLDDFPTLRHVLNFLSARTTAEPPASARGEEAMPQPSSAESTLLLLQVVGTPYAMGYEHGRQRRDEIRSMLRLLAECAVEPIGEGASECWALHERFTADELDELQGIADAVEAPLENLIALQLATAKDVGENAAQIIVTDSANPAGQLVHAMKCPLPLVGTLRGLIHLHAMYRQPIRGIAHVAVGRIGTVDLNSGVNAAGVAITAYSTRPADGDAAVAARRATSGIVRAVLESATDLESALYLLGDCTQVAPWRGCISDRRSDRIAVVHFDGQTLDIRTDESTAVTGGWRGHAVTADVAVVGAAAGASTAQVDAPVKTLRAASLAAEVPPDNWQTNGAEASSDQADYCVIAMEPNQGELWIRGMTPGARTVSQCIDISECLTTTENFDLPSEDQESTRPELPRSSDADVTCRFALEMREAPLPSNAPTEPQWSGAAIILGSNRTAEALRERLTTAGVRTFELAPADDLDALLQQLEQICREQPTPHLFITSARDDVAAAPGDEAVWTRQRHEAMLAPFFVCQKWLQLAAEGKWIDRCSVVAATAADAFGFERGAELAQAGALTGLLKGLFIEFTLMQGLSDLRVKAIDSPAHYPAQQLAGDVFRELASGNLDYEVAYDDRGRRVPYAVEQPATPAAQAGVRRGATWVVTGGARGITARCALELGRRYGLKLHLLGSSPLPKIDRAWRDLTDEGRQQLKTQVMIEARNQGQPAAAAWSRVQKDIEIDTSLRAFAAAGVAATYHTCDVSDRAALAKVLEKVRAQSGPIEGVLHGAGIDRSCRFDRKQRDVVIQTIGAKVDGAANLMALTRQDPIRHFIGYGSIAGRLGSFGQADYALASDMLCKLINAYRRERPWIKAVGIHWHGWDDIGMAAHPETKSVLKEKSDLRLMPAAEGVAHLLRELEADVPAAEVLITERRHWARFAEGLGQLTASRQQADVNAPPATSTSGKPELPPAADDNVVKTSTHRCLLHTLEAPLPVGSPAFPQFDSAVWILGDNADAQTLAEQLRAADVRVSMVKPADDIESTLAELDQLWSHAPAKYLLLMTGRDQPPPDLIAEDQAAARRERGILAPFIVAQRWAKLLLSQPELGRGTIAAAVSLGGDFGFSGKAPAPEGGGISGFLKSVHIESSRREQNSVRTKVIDAPADEPSLSLADAMLRELASDAPEVEVCWAMGSRRVVRPLPSKTPSPLPQPNLRGGTWVVTGGGRGITAIAARELARCYGWKIHLLGKSPAPLVDAPWRQLPEDELKTLKISIARKAVSEGRSPGEAWDRVMKDMEIHNNLEQFRAAGVEATYHCCDITDRNAVAAALEDVRRQDGPIHGILHGAGLIDPARFENKRKHIVSAMVRVKFDGLLHLLSLTRNDPLAYCIGFGSISGRFGGNGLADYAAGNDALAKLIDWMRVARPECASACIQWESWEGSGVATLPRFAWGPKAIMKMKYMMPEEGVLRLRQELEAGLPDSEVLYTFGEFYSMFYPDEQRPLGEFRPDPFSGATSPEAAAPLPLLRRVRAENGSAAGDVVLDPNHDAFLIQHRLRGKPLLPVVVSLEALVEVATALDKGVVTGFRDVQMIDGLTFHSERGVTATATAKLQGDHQAECLLSCDFRNRAGGLIQKDRPYLRAQAQLAAKAPALRADLPAAPTAWSAFAYPDDSTMYHGPPFRGVLAVALQAASGWGRITSLPLEDLAGPQRVSGWTIPSCVLDAAFYACGIHLYKQSDQAISLPRAIDRLDLGRLPRAGETCLVHFACREITQETACYDFTVIGEDQTIVVRAEGYRKVILAREASA